jgi:single-strand DNA-binding protein
MNDLNTVMIEGNLTRDPELTYLPNGTAKCAVSVAVNRSYRKNGEWKKEASFLDAVLWAKLAEYYAEKLSKGSRVRVIGSLKQERWETDGKTRSRIVIVADSVDYWNKRGGQNGSDGSD